MTSALPSPLRLRRFRFNWRQRQLTAITASSGAKPLRHQHLQRHQLAPSAAPAQHLQRHWHRQRPRLRRQPSVDDSNTSNNTSPLMASGPGGFGGGGGGGGGRGKGATQP